MPNDEELLQQLTDLFKEAGSAHHQAHIETDGFHPDWPIWYAEFLHERLTGLLRAKFTRSELVYLLVLVDKQLSMQAPGAYWPAYYASFFLERYRK